MTRPSYQQLWKDNLPAKDLAYLKEKILTGDRYKDWHLNMMPESNVEYELMDAAELLYAGHDELAVQYLHSALDYAQRTLAENKLLNEKCKSSFPFNRGVLTRASTYARWLLGEKLDTAALLVSADDIMEWALDGPWDDQSQAYYLGAVRLALLAGAAPKAAAWLKKKRSMKWHPEQFELMKRLASAPRSVGEVDEELLKQFDLLFDQVRHPNFNKNIKIAENISVAQPFREPHILRLELGLLRDLYFTSPDGALDPRRVIEQISY